MKLERRFLSVAACAITLFVLSLPASAAVTGSGCVVTGTGNNGQVAPTTLVGFNAVCSGTGGSTVDGTFTFILPVPTGNNPDVLNYNLPQGGTNTVAAFLATGSTTCSGAGCTINPFSSGSAGAGGNSGIFDFHYVIGAGQTSVNFGSITHDDGITLALNCGSGTCTNLTPGANTQTASETTTVGTVSVFAGETVDLFYDECCGLAAVLQANLPGEGNITTPEPGSIVLFGTVLLGVVFTVRRRLNLA